MPPSHRYRAAASERGHVPVLAENPLQRSGDGSALVLPREDFSAVHRRGFFVPSDVRNPRKGSTDEGLGYRGQHGGSAGLDRDAIPENKVNAVRVDVQPAHPDQSRLPRAGRVDFDTGTYLLAQPS